MLKTSLVSILCLLCSMQFCFGQNDSVSNSNVIVGVQIHCKPIPPDTCPLIVLSRSGKDVKAIIQSDLSCTTYSFDTTKNYNWIIYNRDSATLFESIKVRNKRVKEITDFSDVGNIATRYYRSGKVKITSYYPNGRKADITRYSINKPTNGKSIGFWENGKRSYIEITENGAMSSGKYWNKTGNRITLEEWKKIAQ